MGVPYTPEQLKKLGLIEVNGTYVKASSQVAKGKVEKWKPLVITNRDNLSEPFSPIYEGIQKIVGTNKKVRNAIKSVNAEGVKFDSNLEKYMYDLLKGAGLTFEFQKCYLLQERFRFNGEAIRAITWTCDFFLPTKNMVIDCKGFSNDIFPLKLKLFKFIMRDEKPLIELPSTKKDCELLLNKLLYDK